jgi:hypothetical protein
LLTYRPYHCVGPYHRNLRQGWQQQVADATNVWHLNMTQDDPDVVVVSGAVFFLFSSSSTNFSTLRAQARQ